MNLLPTQIQNNASNLIDDLEDTFGRPIIVINEIANAVIQNDDNFNPFADNKSGDVTYTAVTQIITARIKHLDKADSETELIFNGRGDSKAVSTSLRQDYGIVRIKVKKQYTDLVKNSTKIIVDGFDCQLLYNYTPISLITTNYSVFYLSRQQ